MKTMNDLISIYLVHLRSVRQSPETIRKKGENLKRFSRWLLSKYQVNTVTEISHERLKVWHHHLSTLKNPKGYPLKATSINRHIITIRGFLKYLAKDGYVQASLQDVLPYLQEPKKLPGSVLPHAQVKKLLSKISTNTSEGYRNRTMLELLYSSGIRANELLSLDVGDVNFSHETAQVQGKGSKERMVPIGKTARRFLESYIVAIRPYLLKDKSEKALFPGKDGKRLSYAAFRRAIVSIIETAGFDDVTAHTFRRSCTTELIRSGANMYHVKELLGHESLDTLKHYAKLTILDLKKTHKKCHPREKDSR